MYHPFIIVYRMKIIIPQNKTLLVIMQFQTRLLPAPRYTVICSTLSSNSSGQALRPSSAFHRQTRHLSMANAHFHRLHSTNPPSKLFRMLLFVHSSMRTAHCIYLPTRALPRILFAPPPNSTERPRADLATLGSERGPRCECCPDSEPESESAARTLWIG